MKRKVKLLRRRSELTPASLSSKEKKGKLPPSSKECFPRLSSFPKQQQPSTTKFYFAQIFLLVDNDDGVFRRHPPFRLLPLGHRVHPLHPHLLHHHPVGPGVRLLKQSRMLRQTKLCKTFLSPSFGPFLVHCSDQMVSICGMIDKSWVQFH